MDGRSSAEGSEESRRSSRLRLLEQFRRAAQSPQTHTPSSPPPLDPRVPPHITRTRTIQSPGSSHLHRHRLRRQREDDTMGTTVQDVVNRLDEATSTLSSALDEPLPHIMGSEEYSLGLIEDMDGYNRRSKRRKLDADPLDTEQSISYGHHGQVAPGRLKMSIVTCDGGHLKESEDVIIRNYAAENILQNDKSVYCTELNKCNIVLKHSGETLFTLSKIVIKTPDIGFTAPVQEGMVFVSMTSENLKSYASQYQMREYCTRRSRQSSSRRHSRTQSGAANNPVFGGLRQISSRLYATDTSSSRTMTGHIHPRVVPSSTNFMAPAHLRSLHVDDTNEDYEDDENHGDGNSLLDYVHPAASIESNSSSLSRTSRETSPSHFQISTTCEEPSGDEEEPSSPAILLDRQQRRNRAEGSSDDEEDVQGARSCHLLFPFRSIERTAINGADAEHIRLSRVDRYPILHAKFFIERKKHVVSIRFEPPVSGRFVLLKLWSPQGRKNIDIQNVSCYGYAGPQFFPSIAMTS